MVKKQKTCKDIQFNTIAYDAKHGNRYYLTRSSYLSNEKYEQYKHPAFVPKTLDEAYYYIKFNGSVKFNEILPSLNIIENNIIKKLKIKNKHEDIWFNKNDFKLALEETKKDILSLNMIVKFDMRKMNVPAIIQNGDLVCFKHIKDELDRLSKSLKSKQNFKILIGEPGTGKTSFAIDLIKKYGSDTTVISLSNLVGANFKARFDKSNDTSICCEFESYTKARFIPKYAKTVVFEEASMLSSNEIDIMNEFIEYADNVIICGDTNQLPGFLGLGNVLYGLLTEFPKNAIKLTVNHRCPPDVVETMHQIINDGIFPTPSIVNYSDAQRTFKTFIDNKEDAMQISFSNDTVDRLNSKAIDYLSKDKTTDIHGKIENILSQGIRIPIRSKENVKVERKICDRSDDKFTYLFYNGEMCWLYKNGFDYVVKSKMFNGHVNHYSSVSDILNHFELGYAMTVHKSQGLEFDYVFYYEAENPYFETRNICYVGYTRSKKQSFIIAPVNNVKSQINYKNIFR